MDGGRTGGLRRADGQANMGQRRGGQADGGQMGGRADGTENGGGRADERTSGRGADRARKGRTSGRADRRMSRGFKRPRTLFPASLSSAQTTRLTAERVCRALGSALGSQPGLCYSFFCSE